MRVYISGPMTGIPGHNRRAFNKAAKRLRKVGYKVINPAEMDHNLKKPLPWVQCLRRDIAQVVKCDGIALLPGWKDSRGAHLEVYIAKKLDMEVHSVAHFVENKKEYGL